MKECSKPHALKCTCKAICPQMSMSRLRHNIYLGNLNMPNLYLAQTQFGVNRYKIAPNRLRSRVGELTGEVWRLAYELYQFSPQKQFDRVSQ